VGASFTATIVRTFSPLYEFFRGNIFADLDAAIKKAGLIESEYVVGSYVIFSSVVMAVVGVGIVLVFLLLGMYSYALLFSSLPILLPLVPYFMIYLILRLKRASLRDRLDNELPYAISAMSALLSSGASLNDLFRIMSKMESLKESAKLASIIYRDITVLGKDLEFAFEDAISRCPSNLYAMVLTNFKDACRIGNYIEYIEEESKKVSEYRMRVVRRFADTLMFLTEVIAALLFVTPLLSVTLLVVIGATGGFEVDIRSMLYILCAMWVPLMSMVMVITIRSMNPLRR